MKPLGDSQDLGPLIKKLSRAKIVMLGESTHGTREFYEWRRIISNKLIAEHGFNFIAVEGDWPPCFELNRSVQLHDGEKMQETLSRFDRWPTWMWANTEIVRLADELRHYNSQVPEDKRAGFYGLDVYSLFESIDSILKKLEKINPFFARRARTLYGCFEKHHQDERAYAKSLLRIPEGCHEEVVQVLEESLKLRLESLQTSAEGLFDLQQNARVIANAENYYRTMVHGNEDSWNVRDRHMMETLNHLLEHYGEDAKAIVWAHNTHIGDYRATSMVQEGQINLGGLARQEWGEEQVALVGMSTYEGEVIASHAWDGPIEVMQVPPAKKDSYEEFLHEVSVAEKQSCFYLFLQKSREDSEPLSKMRGHRAVGVVYHPQYEKLGNYVPTSLSRRYDYLIFVDKTSALTPLIQDFRHEDIPETWPIGQ
jgi:erythromycin esterase-like protein